MAFSNSGLRELWGLREGLCGILIRVQGIGFQGLGFRAYGFDGLGFRTTRPGLERNPESKDSQTFDPVACAFNKKPKLQT